MLIKDFIYYLLKSEYNPTQSSGGALQSAWATFRIWTLVFLISWLGIPISFFISRILGTSFADHAAYEYAANRTLLQVVWGAVLFFPVWEELVFRLGLKFSRLNVSVGLATFIVYISRLSFPIFGIPRPFWLFSPDSVIGVLSIILPVLILAAMIWFALSKIGNEWINRFYQRRFGIIFYAPLLTFAFLHALNFERELWIFAPLITLPQLFLAAGFGYIRMKHGILWSISAHILNNAFSFLPALILEELDPAIYNQFIQGDLIAISKLSPNAASIYFIFSFVVSILLMGIFLSLVSLVWDWVRVRTGRKQYAFLSTTLNGLLPGLGQIYNEQVKKGQVLIGVFLIVSLVVAAIFSLPANSSSMERIVNLGIGTLAVYLTIYGIAIIDAWIVGRRLDTSTMKLHPGEATRTNSRIITLREPAQLSGGIVGLLAGWAIALMIISNALLFKPLAIVVGIAGGMSIGWTIWLAIVKSPFQRQQVK